MMLEGGKLYYDVPVGIICLESWFPKPIGHVRNPRSFDFPIVMKVIKGVDVPRMVFGKDKEIEKIIVDAACELEKEGVMAIAGSCGFMARYQDAVTDAVKVPVVLSSLIQLPIVRLMHGPKAVIGVLTASGQSLSQEQFVGRDSGPLHIQGMEGSQEFRETILEGKRNDFNMDILQKEITNEAYNFAKQQKLDALILECTDLSAFAKPVQEKIKIPVYDLNGVINYVCAAVER